MAKYTNADIDIDTYTWAQLVARPISDGTLADVLEETKTDDPETGGTVTATGIKDDAGALWGNVVGAVLEQVWDKARSGVSDATTTTKGIVELATDGETAADKVVQGNDSRLAAATTTNRGTVILATSGEATAGEAVAATDARLDVIGTASFASTGTEYGAFATLGTVPEGQVWVVTGEVTMAGDSGASLFGGVVEFRITARRRAGGSLSVTTMSVLTNGTGTPAAQHNSTAASSNQLTLESRLSGFTGTIYQSYRYRVTKIVMP